MSLITIDEEKCTLCGTCLEECPFSLLEMKTGDSTPSPREIAVRSAEERCINCGHCMSVCPEGAFTLNGSTHAIMGTPGVQGPEGCLPLRPELDVSKEQMTQLLMGRRTHRSYIDKQVPRETIEEIINLSRYGPSGHNSQLPQWLVINDKEEIRRIGQTVIDFFKENKEPNMEHQFPWDYYGTDSDILVDLWEQGKDSVFRGAPHLIVIWGPGFVKDNYFARVQAPIRLAYLEFAARAFGVRTVWLGFLTAAAMMYPPAAEAISKHIPDGCELYDAICIGYPKNEYKRIPLRLQPNITWV